MRDSSGRFVTKTLVCTVCGTHHFCKGYCIKHYWRWKKTGDPLRTPSGRQRGSRRLCIVSGCGRLWDSHGYCLRHHKLWKRWGVPEKRRRANHQRYINLEGYAVVYAPEHANARVDGWILEHRKVLSETLGRPLTKDEIVHHRNGRRCDNRPTNLELLHRGKHPTGHNYVICPRCGHSF